MLQPCISPLGVPTINMLNITVGKHHQQITTQSANSEHPTHHHWAYHTITPPNCQAARSMNKRQEDGITKCKKCMHITIVGALQGDTTSHNKTNANYNNNHKRRKTHHTYKKTMESQCLTIAFYITVVLKSAA